MAYKAHTSMSSSATEQHTNMDDTNMRTIENELEEDNDLGQTLLQHPSGKPKKRKKRRGGQKVQERKMRHLFNHDNRQRCADCNERSTAWACSSCKRTLPNGTWSNAGLNAEDEEESMMGRTRQMVDLGLISAEDEDFFYVQLRTAMIPWASTEAVIKRSDPTTSISEWNPPKPGFSWASEGLPGEDRDDSIMGSFRKLFEHDLASESDLDDCVWMGRSVAKTWAKISGFLTEDCILIKGFIGFRERKTPADDGREVFMDYSKEILEDEEDTALQPLQGTQSQGEYSKSKAPSLQGNHTQLRKSSVEGLPTFKDLSTMVQARNRELDLEEATKEQIKKDRQARKQEAKAKKMYHQEQERKGLARRAERLRNERRQYMGMADPSGSGRGSDTNPRMEACPEIQTATTPEVIDDEAWEDDDEEIIVFQPRGKRWCQLDSLGAQA